MKKLITLFTALFAVISLMAQSQNFWKDTAPVAFGDTKAYLPTNARSLSLDFKSMQSYLKAAPFENTGAAESNPLLLQLPMPGGEMAEFEVWEISIMEPGLAAAFPMIKTYAGKSKEHPDQFIRLTTGVLGFHATIFKGKESDIIEPVATGNTESYVSYHLSDSDNIGEGQCGNHDVLEEIGMDMSKLQEDKEVTASNKSIVLVNLKTYRLALATTAQYSQQNGATVNSVMNAVTTVMNQVNALLESEVAVRLIMISNTSNTFFFLPDTDQYTNGNAAAMISDNENPNVMNNAYGPTGFDIGHVFGTASGGGVVGIASLGSACSLDNKARGASNTLGPGFYKTVIHEFGHQLNAQHTFDFCDADNESPSSAYQPGGGSTIMSYTGVGVCGANSVQEVADDYFHINALERITAFTSNPVSGGSCATVIATTNNTPEASIPTPDGLVIPIRTPFELTGEATDPDGDDMTYTWEQYDLANGLSPLGMPLPGDPSFRSVVPSNSLTRIFPRIQSIVNNTSQITEVLATVSRPFTFRFTARDNKADGGGYGFAEIKFNASAAAGPFLVNSPNTGSESWEVGDYVEVTWDVANTDGPQVKCQLVDIFLSKDGGFTYPITLLSGTPNDGSAFVVVPDEVTSLARVKVKASSNIFFDISNANFTIVEATAADFTVSNYGPAFGDVCVPTTFDVTFETAAILGFTETISFSASGLPIGATATFSANPVNPGESTTMSVDFTDVIDSGLFPVTVTAEAGMAVEERVVDFNVVSSDFSALQLIAPTGSAINSLPIYTWSDLPNGSSYDIEIASDPGFANIIDGATGLAVTNYQSSVALEENTIYYWRIRVTNECGTGDYLDAGAFRTISQACTTTTSTGQITIPSLNGSKAESVINIPTGGVISDVNVKNITGAYDAFGDIIFRLKGPSATVKLMNQVGCSNPNPFNFGFDDESVLTAIPCPPTAGNLYRTAEMLSVFDGEDAQGDWSLEAEVVTNFGAGGTINSWGLEICGTTVPLDPYLVTNNTLVMQPNKTYNILEDHLVVADDDNTPGELVFTILKNTDAGFISKSGVQLGAGGQFTMTDIYSYQLTYTNTDGSALTDYFTFYVEDPSSGFFGTPKFNIVLDEDADPNAVENLLNKQVLLVYPNPATDMLTLELKDNNLHIQQASIYNAQGQLVLDRQLDGVLGKTQMNISHLPTGVYVVQVRTGEGVAVRKIIVD